MTLRLVRPIYFVNYIITDNVRHKPMIFLETERLLFRSHEAQDGDDFVRMQMDSDVR